MGEASSFSTEELAQLAYQHAGGGDIPGRPGFEEILRTLERGRVSELLGQNSVQVDYGGVRVIINQDLPMRSTAYYPGR
jgi:hypothetical protein